MSFGNSSVWVVEQNVSAQSVSLDRDLVNEVLMFPKSQLILGFQHLQHASETMNFNSSVVILFLLMV